MAGSGRRRRGSRRRLRAGARRPVRRQQRQPISPAVRERRTARLRQRGAASPGRTIGTVDDITLTDSSQAEVTISVDEPLHDGTTAQIRATSLSGIANRYVSISPGPDNAPELEDGATLAGEKTTSPVDLDQLFNTFTPQTRKALRDFIQGSASLYANNPEGAQQTYKYFTPGLASARRLFAELNRDSRALSQFLVQGSRGLGAIADRRDDLSALTQNANEALGAIAQREQRLGRLARGLPAGASPGEHDLRQRARGARRPDAGGRRVQAGDQGPGAVPAQAAPGRRAFGPRLPRPASWRSTAPGRRTT